MTKTKKKWTALAAAAACLALVSLVGWLHSLPPAAYPIVEDYADGVRIQSSFGGDACYAVGTNSIGKPAFVDPEAALAQFQEDQKNSFAWLAAENDLPPISYNSFHLYKQYGWQTTAEDPALADGCQLISQFMDIYENSYPV